MAPIIEIGHKSPRKIVFEWTSDADGKASGVTEKCYSGEIQRIKVTHDSALPPAAAYDIFINDDDGDDIACDMLKDIAPVETKVISSTQCVMSAIVESKLTFNVSGAGGSNKKGKIMVFLR
jgi:hypothetical protein